MSPAAPEGKVGIQVFRSPRRDTRRRTSHWSRGRSALSRKSKVHIVT